MTQKQATVVMTAAVAIVAALVFIPAITGPWIFDDHVLIPGNQYAHSLSWWPRYWLTDFWNVSEEFVRTARVVYWRPLISTIYAVEWQVGAGSPLLYHLTNLLLFAAVGALAFHTLRRWIGAPWPALFAALFFCVHPTKAESVAWISGRTDIVCMLAVLIAITGVARRLCGERGGVLLEALGTFVAYTSKEQASVLPVFVAVEAWVVAGRPAIDLQMLWRAIRSALPQAGIAIAYLIVRRLTLPLQATNVAGKIRAGDHIQAVFESIGRFITLTVAPHDLSIQQGLVRLGNGGPVHSTGYVVLGVISLLALVAIAIVARKRYPFVTVGIIVFTLTLAPTSNIVYTQLETLISERFLFLPMFGISLIIGGLLASTNRRVAFAFVGVVILAAGARSTIRAADFRNEDSFWERERALHPTSPTPRQAEIEKARREKRYRDALLGILELTRTDVDYQDLNVAYQVAELLAQLTPDHDRTTLQAIDSFASDLLAAEKPEAKLAVPGVEFAIPMQTRVYKRYLPFTRLQLITLRATLRSRLGDDESAVALAKEALGECPRCVNPTTIGALVLARAGYYDDAAELLAGATAYVPQALLDVVAGMIEKARASHDVVERSTGVTQLQARAAELASLELWGRAYDVLAPYKEDIKNAPRFRAGFAELALRAGERDVAREMLAGQPDADALLAKWAATMGWK